MVTKKEKMLKKYPYKIFYNSSSFSPLEKYTPNNYSRVKSKKTLHAVRVLYIYIYIYIYERIFSDVKLLEL